LQQKPNQEKLFFCWHITITMNQSPDHILP
jgi:hypothetical protein